MNKNKFQQHLTKVKEQTSTSDFKDSKYQDPPNKDEILKSVQDAETHDQVVQIINETFPEWILGWPKRYCVDYPHFQNNWKFVCKRSGTKTLSVMIVDQIVFNDSRYSLLKLFCELLTLFGHSVRRKEEFVGCKVCGDAIPSEMVYGQLVERNIQVPQCWMMRCIGC